MCPERWYESLSSLLCCESARADVAPILSQARVAFAEAPDLGLEGAEKQEQAPQEDQEEDEDLPDEQLAAKTERQLARKGITFEAKQSAKVMHMSRSVCAGWRSALPLRGLH